MLSQIFPGYLLYFTVAKKSHKKALFCKFFSVDQYFITNRARVPTFFYFESSLKALVRVFERFFCKTQKLTTGRTGWLSIRGHWRLYQSQYLIQSYVIKSWPSRTRFMDALVKNLGVWVNFLGE